MTKEEFLKSKYFKIFLPLLIIVFVIALYKNGNEFGQWLYKTIN